ncbi:MAG: 50S ribosomal protein L25 [Chloroflexi bacterium]|nr:50S ribosomal protein L25 [Chloroflexota bacterium]
MELKVQNRTVLGKQVKTLRKEGLVPAEIYGHGTENAHISVSAKDFRTIFKEAGETTVINLVDEKGEKIPAIVADVAYDHLTDAVLTVDFHRIRLDEKLEAKVPVVFQGSAPAEKKGLVLVHVTSEIDVEALPQDIPHDFPVDLSALENAGQGIYVKDLKASPKVKIKTPGDMAIVTVTEQKKEEATPPPAPAATAEEAAPAAEAKPEGKPAASN